MLAQHIKDIYFNILFLLSYVLLPLYRLHYRLKKSHVRLVHAGCGAHYLDGFINIDGNIQRKVDYLLDLRVGMPFPDNHIRLIYSSHMLEHVDINAAVSILAEWRRVLVPGGYVYLTLPDFKSVFDIIAGREEQQYPRAFHSPYAQAINHLFCDSQHRYAYCVENIQELALQAGFKAVEPVAETDANLPAGLSEPKMSFSVKLMK
ncbi:MAG: methyltransferase domain-containing protein [Proteobacteria bacterium]|nr:methyltransferase domain-containing protein [Pseudomonadota bacterium]MBU1594300.1 methyltransferase domain-containing protein [Pseudomonadota bacterium]